jgi:flagellar hook-length control protein FliK
VGQTTLSDAAQQTSPSWRAASGQVASPDQPSKDQAPADTDAARVPDSGTRELPASGIAKDLGQAQAGVALAEPAAAAQTLSKEVAAVANPPSPTPGASGNQHPPSTMDQIAAQVSRAFDSGLNQVRVQLRPPDLGEVEVIFRQREGHLRVQINCRNVAAFEALQQEASQLERRLSDAGLSGCSVDVAFGGDRSDRQAFAHGEPGETRARSKAPVRVALDASPGAGNRSGLDVVA